MWGKWPDAMLAIYSGKRFSTRGEYQVTSCPPLPSVNKAAHSGFETKRRRHQKSETWLSVTPKMDMCPKFFLKKTKNFHNFLWCMSFSLIFSTFAFTFSSKKVTAFVWHLSRVLFFPNMTAANRVFHNSRLIKTNWTNIFLPKILRLNQKLNPDHLLSSHALWPLR